MQLIRIVTGAVLAGITAVTAVAPPASAAAATGSLAGAVTDTSGAAVTGADIYVYEKDGNWDPVAQGSTDTAGRFRVPGLESGSYEIQIGLGGWSEWAPGRIDDRAAATAYQVVPRRTTNASSVVTAAARITGTVTTATGEPAAGIPISAFGSESASGGQTTTAADGSYAMEVWPVGSYALGFSDGNLYQYSPGTVSFDQATWYPVAPGRTVQVNERLLQAASLTGRLVDAAGAPVADARVRVVTDSIAELWTTTDADGRYRFGKLAPGTVKVSFHLADGREQWAHQASSWEQAAGVVLTLGTQTTVDEQLLPVPAPVG